METLSLVHGSTRPPLLETTIGEALEAAARQWPTLEAVVSKQQALRWTYKELNERASAVAEQLLALGLQAGDRVGIWSPNCAEWVLTQFATARVGLILVTINPAYRLNELEYTLNNVGARLLVCAERFKSSEYLEMVEALRMGVPESKSRVPTLEWTVKVSGPPRTGWMDFDQLCVPQTLGRGGGNLPHGAVRPTDAVNIQFTSGTTGLPKGATLSHRNILNNGYFVGHAIGLRHGDRLCIPVPLYHCFGMVMGNLACVIHGATMVFPCAGFDAGEVLSTIQSEHCSAMYGVPTMFIAMLEHPEFMSFNLSSLRTGIMAGTACPIEVMRNVIDRMHMRGITIAYGMTETSPVSFQSATTDSIEKRVSTVGKVQPHLECKIIDADGSTVPRGIPGELCTRGYSVMIGYWADAERTAEVVDSEGWMHTGDLAVLDNEGYCNIVGRIKDMIIRGGENVYPREIEEFLYQHPKILEVAVVGLPDLKYGEEVCAVVRLREGVTADSEEVRAFCRDRIAHYKVPLYVRFVDALPMTVTGKVQKFLIREQLIRELGLRAQKTA